MRGVTSANLSVPMLHPLNAPTFVGLCDYQNAEIDTMKPALVYDVPRKAKLRSLQGEAVMATGFPSGRTGLSVAALAISTVAAHAAEQEVAVPVPAVAAASGSQTATGDWFGQGPALRAAGFDFRLEWSQFYQGMVRGETAPGAQRWAYGGKWDAQARIDLSKLGFWPGFSFTVQGNYNYGQSVNGIGGALLPINTALFFPGIVGADRSDIMALYFTQNFGDLFTVRAGKINFIELTRATPLKGGGGVDTFWNVNFASPISGILPSTANALMMSLNTQPVSFAVTVFDPVDATNRPLFTNMFENGTAVMASATLRTSVGGLPGFYTINGRYSSKTGRDLSELIAPPGTPPSTKSDAYYVGLSMQQYLIVDPSHPGRGWGIFGEITTADGNPNPLQWSTHFGVGGSSLIPGRPDDRFGVGYFHFGYSDVLKNEIAPVFNLANSWGIEAFYNVAVTPWFRVTGNLQFIRPSNGDRPDSIYAGIGTYVRF